MKTPSIETGSILPASVPHHAAPHKWVRQHIQPTKAKIGEFSNAGYLRATTILFLLLHVAVHAANINYSGNGTDRSVWTDPANWAGGTQYPGQNQADSAYFYTSTGTVSMDSVVTPYQVEIYGVTSPLATINVAVNNSNWISNSGAKNYNLNITTGGTFGNTSANFLLQSGVITVSGSGILNTRFTIIQGTLNIQDSADVNIGRGFAFGPLRYANISGGSLRTSNEGRLYTDGLITQTGGLVDIKGTAGNLEFAPGAGYRISGGTLSIEDNLYFNGANATSLGGTFRVTGGESTINFGGLKYQTTDDQDKAKWEFFLNNSANHITKLNFLGNGDAGGAFRRGTLDVSLEGGIMLSGTNSFVLLEAPTVSTASDYINSADYTGGTAKLWTQGIVDSTRDQIIVTLTGAGAGTLDYTGVNSLTQNGTAYGYVNLGNVTVGESMTMYLKTSGGTLSNFTTALTNAGISWSEATGDYDVALSLTPSVSGGNYFAYDLAKIDAGMTITGFAVDSTFGVGAGNSTTISSGISGGGGLVQNGAGTLILTGSNTYNGTTQINSGTLQLGDGGTSGSIESTSGITNNATLVISRSNEFNQVNNLNNNIISGSGAVIQAGSGALILTGANTYSGGTVVNTGTLVIANATGAGNGTITQTDGTSLLKFDTTGTVANNMSVYNVSSNKTLTLSGNITAQNTTYDVASGTTLSINGTISGNGGVTKIGTGTLELNAANTFNGATVVNTGTLKANATGALANTTNITVTGGSLLVTADNAIGDSVGINLAGGTLEFSGNVTDSIGALTLSANSVIDLGEGDVVAIFADLFMGNYTLAVHNWTGTTLWNGGTGNNTDQIYFNRVLDGGELDRISFYSDFGSDFLGTGFQLGFGSGFQYQVIPVPEAETWMAAALLLAGAGVAWMRGRRRKSGNMDGQDQQDGARS